MRRVALLGLGLSMGCIVPGQFVCAGPDDCGSGRCVVGGNCVAPDPTCPSGERYSKYADPDLANACFDGDGTTSTTDASAAASSSTSTSTSTTTDESSTSSSGEASSSSSSGEPIPVELCNGIDDDLNGLVDEWSPENFECEICPPDHKCKPCDLFPDDEANPTRTYYMCSGANYDEIVSYCEALGAPTASIHSEAENTFLAIKVAAFAKYSAAQIGLRDFGDAGTPMWTWVDGSPFDYHRLGDEVDTHPPDDVCVALTSSATWDATHCNGGRTFICEAPLPIGE